MRSFDRLGRGIWVLDIPDLEALRDLALRENYAEGWAGTVVISFDTDANDGDAGGPLPLLEIYDDYRE